MLTSEETCRRKRTFITRTSARKAAKRRNLREDYKWTRHYRCNVCGLYHLTTKKATIEEEEPNAKTSNITKPE